MAKKSSLASIIFNEPETGERFELVPIRRGQKYTGRKFEFIKKPRSYDPYKKHAGSLRKGKSLLLAKRLA